MKLMIVEDNPEFRKMLRNMFSEYFMEIFESDNGYDAVRNYEDHKPDWVFMDIGLKRMDGIHATKKIVKKFADARIIMVSQYNSVRMVKASKEAGAIDFVSKDDVSKLIRIVNRR